MFLHSAVFYIILVLYNTKASNKPAKLYDLPIMFLLSIIESLSQGSLLCNKGEGLLNGWMDQSLQISTPTATTTKTTIHIVVIALAQLAVAHLS